MKQLVFCYSALGDNGNIYKHFLSWLNDEAASQGVVSTFLNIDTADGLRALIRKCEDQNSLIYSGIWAYDARIHASAGCSQSDLYENSGATLLATVGDHPFASFMQHRIANASKEFVYGTLDPSYKRVMTEITGKELNCIDIQAVPSPRLKDNAIPNLKERNIFAFFPMNINYQRSSIDNYLNQLNRFDRNQLVDIYNSYKYESEITAYEFFERCICGAMTANSFAHVFDRSEYFALLRIISEADFRERYRNRIDILQTFSKRFINEVIVVAGEAPKDTINLPPNVIFTGFIDYSQVLNFYVSSKILVHSHPTYFNGLHERPIHAQALGCLLATPKMSWTNLLQADSFLNLNDHDALEQAVSEIRMNKWPELTLRLSNLDVSKTYGSYSVISGYINRFLAR